MTVVPDSASLTTSYSSVSPAAPRNSGHKERIPALDGVRGVAALMILVYHFMPQTSSDPFVSQLIFWNGINWVGVDLFFVLSGFLITGILMDAKGTPHYFRNFYARRALRIFPMYYGTLIAIFILFPIGGMGIEPSLESRLGNYYREYKYLQKAQAIFWLYISNVPGLVNPQGWLYFMSHFWSLTVEEHFYLIWPAVVLLMNRRRLIATCLACIAVSLVGRILINYMYGPFFCYIFSPLRMDGLASGSLLVPCPD